jgi:uncharacterized NAD(P)/FAD-binding protein YdhS
MRSHTMPSPHVAIAGGGASGLLLAAVLERAGAAVTIVEPRERLGAGVAYATMCPVHLLNAPVANMSAFAGDATHFARWLAANGEHADPSDFVPRALYGRYLGSIADDLRAAGGNRIAHVRSTVTDVESRGDGVHITCADGSTIDAGAFVVAVGNAEPAPWPRITGTTLTSQRFFTSAWAPGAIEPHDPDELVVLLGTGLTAIDATLGLRAGGHRGPIVMISRRGLLPHEHRVFDSPPAAAPEAENVRDLIGALRLAARSSGSERGWRGAIDQLRSQTNARWGSLSLEEQRRIVRHALPYWNVHRHRIAPAAAKAIAELIAANTLRMIAGRTGEIVATPDALHVHVRLRGSPEELVIDAGRVINCSGPQNDFRKLPNPLIRRLIERDYLVPHELGIGANIASDGALIDRNGNASTQLYAIGPVRFGTLIETTAIPEIRAQADELAKTLTQARGALSSSSGNSCPSITPGTR